jgi:hypothetical protein
LAALSSCQPGEFQTLLRIWRSKERQRFPKSPERVWPLSKVSYQLSRLDVAFFQLKRFPCTLNPSARVLALRVP